MKGYEELVQTLKMMQASHVTDCTTEAICEYQDMIAHSSIEQLEELANGSYKESFYRLYGIAYGTIEAIRFHCKHSQNIREILETNADQSAEIDRLNFLLTEQKKDTDAQKKACEEIQSEYATLADQNMKQTAEIETLKAQMQELKAKLYDLMTA
jgi:predicted RNase H-like nuclease (RuvC/YqgF family)